uniref:NADH dehydrogenase subunit 6 n=1 Tax=Scaphidium formosanum TaxID=2828454 RepID=UPI001BEF6937|nr:NADH dehydrogenase subunit 6 [Scaphidium formosanum]QTZ18655.1 NADH dehydrogenase subunit 6 [Scaphidium formosanum]
MFSISMTIAFLLVLMNHPLTMGLILLLQTILITLISSTMMTNFWFSYILFLIMISGMLVLFIYMTSLASNEKFKYSNKLMLLSISTMSTYLIINKFMINNNNMDFMSWNNNLMFKMNLSKFLNSPSNLMMIMLIIYLLITLIAIVKITNTSMGPLRPKS